MPDGRTVTAVVKRTLLAVLAAQATVIAVLVGVDGWRKRFRPRRARFPRTAPEGVDVDGTSVTVYTYGEDLFQDMLRAIHGAQHRILFETFIIKDDTVGRRFKTALVAAARRGVEVCVIYDGFANLVVPSAFLRFPRPVRVLRYPAFRPGLLLLNIRKSGRDHRKILTVDGEVGFVGGYNVGAWYATRVRDTHVRLAGPSVWELENTVVDFWNTHRADHHPVLDRPGDAQWAARIRTYRNVPEQLIYPIRAMLLEAIDRAESHIHLTQAYFLPDQKIVDNLVAAARRGVDVHVLLPERSNHIVADWLSRNHYAALLEGGVHLWLFQHGMLHAKTATVDGQWSTVGTANIDRVSLTGNYEVNLEVLDPGVAARLERVFANDRDNARRLTAEEWHHRPVWSRAGELLLRPLRPLL